MPKSKTKTVDELLSEVDYGPHPNYRPTMYAMDMINFIKLVNGPKGEENKTPEIHLHILDTFTLPGNTANLAFRGSGKTTVCFEYGILYMAVYGYLPNFGEVSYILYVTDSMDNGVKSMRKNLESRYNNSPFLQKMLPTVKFTDNYWEFTNIEGHVLSVNGYGACTGIRGTKKQGTRPQIALLDDLLSDEDAKSPTVINDIENTIYKAVFHALHPKRHKVIWSGTPFNKKDPLYKAVESGAWNVNVFPVCEKFPCTKEEFKGAWEDRFTYEHLLEQWNIAQATGTEAAFNQELMLQIMADNERLVQDEDIRWYSREDIFRNSSAFNYYITTDFAVSDKTSADYSVISVWAYSNNGDFYWVDGQVRRCTIDISMDKLFEFNAQYKPLQVGIEVTGQQSGFIDILMQEGLRRQNYINFARDGNSNRLGIRPTNNKMVRFNQVVPWFKAGKFYFPIELKETYEIKEIMNELRMVAVSGMRSAHDDCLDTISMLASMKLWKPIAQTTTRHTNTDGVYCIDTSDYDYEESSSMCSYVV